MKTKIVIALASWVLVGGSAMAQRHAPRGESPRREARQELGRSASGQRDFGRLRERFQRLRRARDFARSLEITPEQREQARDAARALSPEAAELRARARQILERARALKQSGDREGARQHLRAELRPLIEEAKSRGGEHARPLIGTLTPEQRERFSELARRHGRTFDDERAAEKLGRMLGSRRAGERFERLRQR
jgi:hypothetical protein